MPDSEVSRKRLAAVCTEVLAHDYSTDRQWAYTGEVMAAYGEINHILGSTKGVLEYPDWRRLLRELDDHLGVYVAAWEEFKASPMADDTGTVWVDGRVTRGFQQAAEGLRALLEEARAIHRDHGLDDWTRFV